MTDEIDRRIKLELESRRERRNKALSNQELYRQRLLEEFPLDLPTSEKLFHKNSFTDSDEIDYLKGRAVFEGKKWNEVDLDVLYQEYVQFVPLLPQGMIYYLPTFLSYYYDMRHPNSEFRQAFLANIYEGFRIPSIEELDTWSKQGIKPASDYKSFEIINPSQSKLIAFFLVNEANLSPVESSQSNSAQVALTNYWGTFLLF